MRTPSDLAGENNDGNDLPPTVPAVFVASHRRSGTHLTLDSLVANFNEFRDGFENFDSEQDNNEVRLFKTHISGTQAAKTIARDAKVIYVVRDGRDVMVSLFNYVKSYDSQIAKMSLAEFLLTENTYDQTAETRGMNRVEYWNHHVQSWLQQQELSVATICFDQWKESTDATVAELSEFFGCPPKPNVKSMVIKSQLKWANRVLAKLGWSNNTAVQFRGGKSQVWKEHFDSKSLDFFVAESKKSYQLISDRLECDFPL